MKNIYIKIANYEKDAKPVYIDGTYAVYLVNFKIGKLDFQGEIACDLNTGEIIQDKITEIQHLPCNK